MTTFIDVKKLYDNAKIPKYMTEGAAGCDMYACVSEPVVIEPGETKLVSAGISVAIPEGFEIQVRPRSGLTLKHGVTVANAPGTINVGRL